MNYLIVNKKGMVVGIYERIGDALADLHLMCLSGETVYFKMLEGRN